MTILLFIIQAGQTQTLSGTFVVRFAILLAQPGNVYLSPQQITREAPLLDFTTQAAGSHKMAITLNMPAKAIAQNFCQPKYIHGLLGKGRHDEILQVFV